MKAGLIGFFSLALLGAVLLIAAPGGFLDGIPLLLWRWGGSADIWPRIEHMDVAIELSPPGGFEAQGTLQLSGVVDDHFVLLLNEELSVRSVSAVGVGVSSAAGFGLGTRYHSEGRAVHFSLDEAPADGLLSLHLKWSGEAEHGPDGSDWRGILMVDETEARMCEQTIFCPQVPTAVDGPGVQRSTFSIQVTAPAAWEMYSPGQPVGEPEHLGDQRVWRYASEQPGQLSIVGGERVRHEIVVGDRRVVTLLRDEHAELAEGFAQEVHDVLEVFGDWFGDAGAGSMGLFEQCNRKDYSYNWFAFGLAVFDRGALGGGVPATKVAHEMAHLWWGQTVSVDGPGERFLTEGLAEASALLFFERKDRGVEVQLKLDLARKSARELAEEDDSLAMDSVRFGSSHYSDLAYRKGGLVHRYVLGTLGVERSREFIRAYRGRAEGRVATLADWKAALSEVEPELPVPWVDHAGDFELSLHDVEFDAVQGKVTGTMRAQHVGPDRSIPLQAMVDVDLVGRGFSERHQVVVSGESTTLELTLDRSAAAALSGDEELVLFSVQLDPEHWLPLGAGGAVVLSGPRLLASSPEQGDLDVTMGLTRIELTFDEPLQDIAVIDYQSGRPTLSGDMLTPFVRGLQVADDGLTVTLEVSPLKPGKRYQLPLRGAFRNGDNAVPVDEFLIFETAESTDNIAPQVLSSDPPNGVTDLAVSTTELTLTFDEPMMRGSGFDSSDIRDLQSDGYSYPEMEFGFWDDSATVLTIPLKGLAPGVQYALPIGRPLKDLSGNTAAKFVYYFTTEGAMP